MVNALFSGSSGPGSSPGWGHCVVFLLCSSPLSTRVYKWVPATSTVTTWPKCRLYLFHFPARFHILYPMFHILHFHTVLFHSLHFKSSNYPYPTLSHSTFCIHTFYNFHILHSTFIVPHLSFSHSRFPHSISHSEFLRFMFSHSTFSVEHFHRDTLHRKHSTLVPHFSFSPSLNYSLSVLSVHFH